MLKGGCIMVLFNGSFREIDEKKLPLDNKSTNFKVVGSDLIKVLKLKNISEDIKKKKNVEIVSMGSSLKICL